MNNIAEFLKCSNCGACYNICPKEAISLQSDMFYSPVVDETKCISCGLCKNICPVNTPQQRQSLRNAYAGYHTNPEIIKKSSSGGAFFAIADYIINELNGIVYAAAYTENCREVVFRSTEEVSLFDLMKSKYVESKVEYTFREIKEKLSANKIVLFCGAPCQVAGLKRYLGKEYENLYTSDFSCGGMSSHKTYYEYLTHIEKKLQSKIASVDFRAKIYGWLRHSIKIKGENQKVYKNFAQNDPYFYSFIGNHINIREYCLDCNFGNNHYSDIILADFWGYEKYSKVKNDDTGLSLLITNSEKGEHLIEKIKPQFAMTVLDLEKASYNMKDRQADELFLQKRELFFDECRNNGFLNTINKIKRPSNLNLRFRYLISKFKNLYVRGL